MDNNEPKFNTVQIFVWRDAKKDCIEGIFEASAKYVRVLKDVVSERLTNVDCAIELHAFDKATNDPECTKSGMWPVTWDLPPRCRKKRPCIIVNGTPVDMVEFVRSRS